MKQWVTFQLSERGENTLDESPSIITRILSKYIKSEFFYPMYFHNAKAYTNKIYLIRGYIFIEFNKEEVKFYTNLVSSPYFIGPLLVNKRIHLTPDSEITRLKKQLEKLSFPKIKLGDTVKVIDGKYKNLKAKVTEIYSSDKTVDLTVKLKCMAILVPKVPIVCLENIASEAKSTPKNSLEDRIIRLLSKNKKGLTRREILDRINITDKEKKRLSTCLSRAVKKGLLTSKKNKYNKNIFKIAI